MLAHRLLVMLLSAAVLASNCTGQQAGGTSASEDVERSRNLRGRPLVALAEAGLTLSEDVDALRHEVERGEPMRRDLKVAQDDIAQLRKAARRALTASRRAPVEEAGQLVAQ